MKTKNDIKNVNDVAVLDGIKFIDEGKMFCKFLKENPQIKLASICTEDKRHFALIDEKLIYTKEETFINPYYVEKEDQKEVEVTNENNIELRIKTIEEKVEKLLKIKDEIIKYISNYVD